MPTDIKTTIWSLAPSISGDFQFASSTNAPADFSLNNGANWSNQTTSVEPTDTAGVNLLNIGGINYGAVGAIWYIGSATMFDVLTFQFSTGTDNTTRTVTWEYWNGSTWTALAQSGSSQRIGAITGGSTFQNGTQYIFKIHEDIYRDWATTTVNGGTARYYIRMTVASGAFTNCSLTSTAIWNHRDNYGTNHFDKVFTTTDDAAFTDVTLVARSGATGSFTFTANTTNARMYMGLDTDNLSTFRSTLTTAGTVGNGVWEYWNGAWVSLPYEIFGNLTTNVGELDKLFSTNSSYFTLKAPLSDWATTTVNGVSKFWIRYRVTSNYTISPVYGSLIALKSQTLSRTIYAPETTNRTFQSVIAKIHVYNPLVAAVSRFNVFGRLGSGSYIPVNMGEGGSPLGTFSSIGGGVWSTTANDGAFTDETGDSSDSGSNDVGITNTVNSNLYFRYPNNTKFANNNIQLSFSQSNSVAAGGVVAWEYWDGSAWTAFTPIVNGADQHLNQKSAGAMSIQIPLLSDWATNTVNSVSGYHLRRRITTIYSNSPVSYNSILTSYPSFNSTSWTNSGENNATSFFVDLTNLFNTQFSGTSQQLDLRVACENISSIFGDNPVMSAELYVTYAADSQSSTIKSVMIPLDSSSSVLTSTLTSIGSSQIPQLSTYLPEASKTIRNFYIVFTGNDIMNTSIATEFGMRLDSDAARYTWAHWSGGTSGNIFKYIFAKDDVATGATHDIQMSITGRNVNIKNWQMYAVVTYEYDASATTRTINSLMLPFETSSIFLPQDNILLPEQVRKTFYIQEPGTIDNELIGCYLSFTDNANPFLKYKEKDEVNFTSVSWSSPATTCGGFRYSWRLPSQNLSRGLNTIGVDLVGETKSLNEPSCAYTCGYFIVNYQSDVASTGAFTHNKTLLCRSGILTNISARNNRGANLLTTTLPNYYINDFGLYGEFYQTTVPNTSVTVDSRYVLENANNTGATKAVLGAGGGWQESESLMYDFISSDRNLTKKFPNDPADHRLIDVFNGGNWLVEYGYFSAIGAMHTIAVCHEITYNVFGNVIGYSGNGAGLTVTFYDNDTSEIVFTTTTVAGGTFTATWYDNTRNIICDVYDPTLNKYAESNFGIAGVTTFTLRFPTPYSAGYIT